MTDAPKTIAEMREAAARAAESFHRHVEHPHEWPELTVRGNSLVDPLKVAAAIRALPLPDDAEMVERVARALLVSEPEAYANSQELLDEHFEWWRAGRDDPESCVHYSSIGIAIRQARAALSAMRGEP